MTAVKVVRVYLTESGKRLDTLLKKLHDQENVRGVTVFRGVSGFGKSGKYHSSHLVDLSSDLPLVLEFFDDPERIDAILAHLAGDLEAGHVISWLATVNV